ncbi:AAA family ATPase [Virgibacillus dakarensis]|uniref:AAA family ATPase n=1 Tax=Virgibacillus dakarensis TaxID=1917889 RepID=UPI000B44C123|nr:AAA family ATPase [Virgibacillus dakarensis]
MINNGFYIKKLCVLGNNTKNAEIEFEQGLNIITGPSDTGKSYIFDCLNYMLGSSKVPKKIDEAKGYSTILMEIRLYSGEDYTIERNIGETEVEVYQQDIHLTGSNEEQGTTLNLKHDKEKTDNLSAFYLDKSGYNHPIYVKTNKSGDFRTLSFRDFPLYIAISEDKIIKENSPIFSGQYTKMTVEKSIFNFIVSGIDYKQNVHDKHENKPSKTKLEGQIELLNRFIAKEEIKLEEINGERLPSQSTLTEKMMDIQSELDSISNELAVQTEYRRELWNNLEESKSRIIADSELIKRFHLLRDNYVTDLERLNFVLEGNHYFSQLNIALCPYCNQPLNENCMEHSPEENQIPNELATSIEVEIEKIKGKLNDLDSTIKQAESDYKDLKSEIERYQEEYNLVKDKIDSILQPKQIELKNSLNTYLKERDIYKEYNTINEKLDELRDEEQIITNLLKNIQTTKPSEENDNEGVISSINEFCKYMAKTLEKWKFSKDPKVDYDDGKFYINSKKTEDYGKGYRAIIYSGFAISLMQYCKAYGKPHPGFVVLDSPLTTYRGKKSDEDINEDIQQAFFKDVSSLGNEMQIIILDNKEPNKDVKKKINYEEFTKDVTSGRYGFFPVTN